MDYSKMSDVEINHAVASVLPGRYITYPGHVMNSETEEDFDPCNNPEDAWPIISEHNIAVVPYRHTLPQAWPTAFGMVSKFTTEDKNPLRAAMIVFLKMQESANVPDNPPGTDLL